MSRAFKLSPCIRKIPLRGEGVDMPPLDSAWVDQQYTQWTIPSFPENLPMPDPGYIPLDAPNLMEWFGDSDPQEVFLCIIMILLLIIVLLLLMLVNK